MKNFILSALLLLSPMVMMSKTNWHWEKGTIVVDTPQRPVGQQDALSLKVAPIPIVKVAFVGLGMRGPGAVKRGLVQTL